MSTADSPTSDGPDQTEPLGPQSVPVLPEAKPRLLQDGRDMFWSIAPLVLACILLAALVGRCSFAPSGPTPGPTPVFDVPVALKADAAVLKIPLRIPAVPPNWHANSGSRGGIDGGRVDPVTGQRARALSSTVGYLTASGMYLALIQSNADEQSLVGSIDRGMYPTGVQDIDGVHWVVYDGAGDTEPVWTVRLPGPEQVAVSGAASADDYRVLAKAVQAATPLK